MKEYTVLKLINGYDIICSYSKENSAELTIEVHDPMMMMSSVSRDGLHMIYLKRYNVLAASNKMAIRKSQIISSYPPRTELVHYYNAILKYYKEDVDDTVARQLDVTTKMFETSLKQEDVKFKDKLDTTLEEMFEEYEKELRESMEEPPPSKKRTKNTKVH